MDSSTDSKGPEAGNVVISAQTVHWSDRVEASTRGISVVGYLTIAAFVGGFGVWAATAPLAGATVAPGVVAAAGQNIMIQHLEGGIIREILVSEGERVEAGQALINLDTTATEAQLNRILKQLVGSRARAVRLEAERADRTEMKMPADIVAQAEAINALDVVREQESEFAARHARYVSEVDILGKRIQALQEAVQGLEAQKKASQEQIDLVREEAKRKETLLQKGLTNRSEYSNLLRAEADLVGQLGQLQSQIASSITQTAEAREEVARRATSRVEDAVSSLNEVRVSIADLEEQERAARDILQRTVIRAPGDGIVIKMIYNAPGSVIGAGQPIIELLPTTESPVIETRIAPKDIDTVYVGQSARMRLSALNQRTTPEVDGTVIYRSADRFIDEVSHQPYYVARLKISETLPDSVKPEQIYPGMPVEAYLNTGERTFLYYLFRPILDSLNRAFRED